MEESKLVKRAQKGDRDAMEALIGGYYPLVFAYFYKNTGRYHQSKDLTQEVFIKMISGLSGYRPRAAFKSWLFAIASNHLKNHYRSASRRPEPAELSEALQEVLPADSREISRAARTSGRPWKSSRRSSGRRWFSGFTMILPHGRLLKSPGSRRRPSNPGYVTAWTS